MRRQGPFARFDHHHPGRPGAPLSEDDRGIWYAGRTLDTALIEVFGSADPARVVDLGGTERAAVVRASRPLRLLDLRGAAALRAGTVHALCAIPDYHLPQAWSRYFHEHPEIYGEVDGLLYPGAHDSGACVALYERASAALTSAADEDLALSDLRLRRYLDDAAIRLGLTLLRG